MIKSDEYQYGLEVTAAPAIEPVTTDEAIAHLREEEDLVQTDIVEALITAARTWVEEYLQRSLLNTTFTLYLDNWGESDLSIPAELVGGGIFTTLFLPRPKVSAVSAIRYIDDAGTQQTLATSKYRTDLKSLTARVSPAYGEVWPSHRAVSNAIEVDFVAGYGAEVTDVPQPIKTAILFLVSHWYDNRSPVELGSSAGEVPMTVKFLLGPFRVRS